MILLAKPETVCLCRFLLWTIEKSVNYTEISEAENVHVTVTQDEKYLYIVLMEKRLC